jgi:methionyl-tRNA formyltransferase
MNNFNVAQSIAPNSAQTQHIKGGNSQKLKVVTFNYLPSAYKFATDWIRENGHDHILAVTSPGIKTRATPSYQDVLAMVDKNVSAIATSKMKSVLTPILHQLKPDIVLCFTFAHRLDAELCQIPKYGVVNIHPSVLPAYRGPNPLRQFYDGANVFGATAHRIADDYDTGDILSVESAEMPAIITQNISLEWGNLIKKAIANGMERAISGKPGIIQDHTHATYASPFVDEEKWVNLNEPSRIVLCKTLGLNLAGGLAKTTIQGQVYKIHSAHHVSSDTTMSAGTVIKQNNGIYQVATADGIVKLVTEPFNPNKQYSHVLPFSALFGQPANAEQVLLSAPDASGR